MSNPPIIAFPDTTKQFVVFVDASEVAAGSALMQNQDSGRYHPASYERRSLSEKRAQIQNVRARGGGCHLCVEEVSTISFQWIARDVQ